MNFVFARDLVKLRVFFAPFGVKLFGRVHRSVRYGGRDIAKERCFAFGIGFNELHGVVHHDVVNVGAFFQLLFLPVVDVSCGVVGVGDHLALPTHELIESMSEWIGIACDVGMAKPPFPISTSVVSGCFENLWENSKLGVERRDFVFSDIAAKVDRAGLVTGHEDSARGTADGVAGVMGGKF